MDNMNKVAKKLPGRLCTFLCTGLIGLAIAIFYATLPFIYIIIGAIYWDAKYCRADNLPALLISGGLLGLILILCCAIERRFGKSSIPKPGGFWLRIFTIIIGIGLVCWLIASCIIVFKLHSTIEHTNETAGNYCNEFLYNFTFWSLIVILTLFIVHFIVLLIIGFCCAEKIIKALAKREAKAGVVGFITNA